MFTQVPAAAPTSSGHLGGPQVSQHNTTSSSPSASRPSRLRGLSYLRNYTHTHLLSREQSSTSQPSSPSEGPSQTQASTTISLNTRPTSTLHRTTSASATSTISSHNNPSPSRRTNPNRLTLVNHEALPLNLAPPPRPTACRRSTDSALPHLLVDLASQSRISTPSSTGAIETPFSTQSQTEANMVRTRSATMSEATPTIDGNGRLAGPDILPSIRFSTFYDPRAARPSLTFPPVSRTLPTGTEVIRVGRYSERDNQPNIPINIPSSAPVGFKSKVVSRRHCEFWYEDGKWYIKDVKSSSGTFLNHIRLSPPGTESKPFPVNDGDIVQLGIDFKGGEEMIFRCVKMRLELNRGWQNKLNTFNLTTHKRLRNMTNSGSTSSTQDCSICLNSIAPCQCLFVAPCSHTWHYKCIRALLASPSYPIFICPNCRAAADLEADVEDPEEWEKVDSEEEVGSAKQEPESPQPGENNGAQQAAPRKSRDTQRSARSARTGPEEQHDADMTMMEPPPQPANFLSATTTDPGTDANQLSVNATSSPMAIPAPRRTPSGTAPASNTTTTNPSSRSGNTRTPSPTTASHGGVIPSSLMNGAGHEGPITPRNDAGPWVFDGSGVRMRVDLEDIAAQHARMGVAVPRGDLGNGNGEMIPDDIHLRES